MTNEDIDRVRRGEATWGMIAGDFRSLQGIPDDFCSAEDPKDRIKLWNEAQARQMPDYSGMRDCDIDPMYRD